MDRLVQTAWKEQFLRLRVRLAPDYILIKTNIADIFYLIKKNWSTTRGVGLIN